MIRLVPDVVSAVESFVSADVFRQREERREEIIRLLDVATHAAGKRGEDILARRTARLEAMLSLSREQKIRLLMHQNPEPLILGVSLEQLLRDHEDIVFDIDDALDDAIYAYFNEVGGQKI